MTGFNVPTTEDKADCLDSFVAYGDAELEGSKSVRFGCEYFPPPGYHAEHKEPSKGHHKRPGKGGRKGSAKSPIHPAM